MIFLGSHAKIQVIVGVAGGHVMAAAWDQFVGNVMRGEGGLHQVSGWRVFDENYLQLIDMN